jgi:hypothetical protein
MQLTDSDVLQEPHDTLMRRWHKGLFKFVEPRASMVQVKSSKSDAEFCGGCQPSCQNSALEFENIHPQAPCSVSSMLLLTQFFIALASTPNQRYGQDGMYPAYFPLPIPLQRPPNL